MATVATISVNFANYGSTSFTAAGVTDRSINPLTLSQFCLGSSSGDFSYIGGFVKKTGDTMSGMLTLPLTMPTTDNHATRKGYVDSRINSLSATVSNTGPIGYVRISGSTMSGMLTLPSVDPTNVNHSTRKAYVDSRINSLSGQVNNVLAGNPGYLKLSGGNMTGLINMGSNKITQLPTTGLNDTDAVPKKYVDDAIGGGTSGLVSKTYVDNADNLRVLKAGDTMTGRLAISDKGFRSAIKDNLTLRTDSGFFETATPTTDEGWPETTNGWYQSIAATHTNDANYFSIQFAGSINNTNNIFYRATNGSGSAAWRRLYHEGNIPSVPTQLGYTPVNKAGDTMTNFLTLHANPTANLHAATKKYVDDAVGGGTTGLVSKTYVDNADNLRVLKAGDTMTGTLNIVGTTNRIGVNTAYTGASIDVRASTTNIDSNAAYIAFHRPNKFGVRFGLDTDNKLKVGGWSMGNVAYEILNSDNYKTYVNPDSFLKLTGGSMSGNITLPAYNANSTNENHAVTKKYVDDAVGTGVSGTVSKTYVDNADNLRVLKTGDTMTGTLNIDGSTGSIGRDFTTSTGTTIDVVANRTNIGSNAAYMIFRRPGSAGKNSIKFGLDTDGKLKVGGLSMGNVAYEILNSDNYKTYVNPDSFLKLTGGTMSGNITLPAYNANSTNENHATTKKYVDDALALKASTLSLGGYLPLIGGKLSGNLAIESITSVLKPTLRLADNGSSTSSTTFSTVFLSQINDNFQIRRGLKNGTIPDGGPNGRQPLTVNLTNGNVTASGDVTAYSDERLKKNVLTIENALDKTLKLEGVSFEKIETSKKGIGLIAQKVKEVLPEVVTEDEDGYLAVSYGNIVGLLVEAIKELSTKVDNLEKQLNK